MLKRILSAIFALSLALPVIIYLGKFAVYGLSILLILFCSYEVFSLFCKDCKELKIFGTIIAVFIYIIRLFYVNSEVSIISISFMVFSIYYLLRAKNFENLFYEKNNDKISLFFIYFLLSFFTIVYFSIFISYIPKIRSFSNGIYWFFLHLAVVWAGDTGGYIFGRKYGKKKLYSLISPGKSVEGSLAGLLASLFVVFLFKLTVFKNMDIIDCINIGIIGGLISQLGDLFESFIKRSAQVKDSGQFMPGHGGVFDRFDGVIFSAPFFYYYIDYFFKSL